MVAALRPKAAGWWGQELSFGPVVPGPPEIARRHGLATTTPPPRRSDTTVRSGYLAFCAT